MSSTQVGGEIGIVSVEMMEVQEFQETSNNHTGTNNQKKGDTSSGKGENQSKQTKVRGSKKKEIFEINKRLDNAISMIRSADEAQMEEGVK